MIFSVVRDLVVRASYNILVLAVRWCKIRGSLREVFTIVIILLDLFSIRQWAHTGFDYGS